MAQAEALKPAFQTFASPWNAFGGFTFEAFGRGRCFQRSDRRMGRTHEGDPKQT
jgi:hypothetical protein